MKKFKAGDVVICVDNSKFKLFENELPQIPEENVELKVKSVITVIGEEGVAYHLELEGFIYDAFDQRFFEKRKEKSLARQLAEDLINNTVRERPEYERVFCLTADF